MKHSVQSTISEGDLRPASSIRVQGQHVPDHALDLIDVGLEQGEDGAEALNDRTSFRRFCGVGAHEPPPERTVFGRFRRVLVRLELDHMLFEAVTGQLDARGVVLRRRMRWLGLARRDDRCGSLP